MLFFSIFLKLKFKIMGKNQSADIYPNSINLIGKSTNIVGDINSESDIRIDGNIKGTVQTKGKIIVGQTGVIIGNIICQNADIEGKIEGKINVENLLSLKSTANVQGEIFTEKLAIEPNAVFTGTCNMGKSLLLTDNE
jgi:cytoskeletal protein CcmA (bactofilin family)